jgi:hypothetical protein
MWAAVFLGGRHGTHQFFNLTKATESANATELSKHKTPTAPTTIVEWIICARLKG